MMRLKLILLACLEMAHAGQEGHGGHPLLVTFSSLGKQVYFTLQQNGYQELNLKAEEWRRLKEAIFETRLEFTNEPIDNPDGNGHVVSRVIDDPKRPGRKLIQFGEEDELRRYITKNAELETHVMYQYVLHEYLLAAGIDDKLMNRSTLFKLPQKRKSDSQEKKEISWSYELGTTYVPMANGKTVWENRKAQFKELKQIELDWLINYEATLRSQISPEVDVTIERWINNFSKETFTDIFDSYSFELPFPIATHYPSRAVVSLTFPRPAGFTVQTTTLKSELQIDVDRSLDQIYREKITEAMNQVRASVESQIEAWRDDIRSRSGASYLLARCNPVLSTEKISEQQTRVSSTCPAEIYLMSSYR